MASKFKLLNIDANAKTVKGQAQGYMTAILYLTPSDASGVQLCAMSHLARCAGPCLNLAGRGGMSKGNATFISPGGHELSDNAVQRARLRRTELFLRDRDAFMALLVKEIRMAERMAQEQGLTLAIRLNGTSDIRWEDIPLNIERGYYNVFRAFPHIQFYDYTKIPNRRRALIIPNYHLTFSYSGVSDFAPVVLQALRNYENSGVNLAVVFRGDVPKTFLGRYVINGDESDLRFLDKQDVVIALKAKGKAKRDTSGFVVDHTNSPAMSAAA